MLLLASRPTYHTARPTLVRCDVRRSVHQPHQGNATAGRGAGHAMTSPPTWVRVYEEEDEEEDEEGEEGEEEGGGREKEVEEVVVEEYTRLQQRCP